MALEMKLRSIEQAKNFVNQQAVSLTPKQSATSGIKPKRYATIAARKDVSSLNIRLVQKLKRQLAKK